MEDEHGSRLCLVCTSPSDAAHFGVDCCRACAAFFRRSVKQSKEYLCRQSSNNCHVHKDNRFMCRKCRFDKCIAIGMRPENVNSKAKVLEHTAESDDSGSPEGMGAGPSTSLVNPSSSASIPPQTNQRLDLIERMRGTYALWTASRMAAEKNALYEARDLSAIPPVSVDLSDNPIPATWSKLNILVSLVKPAYREYSLMCYEDNFDGLEDGDKVLVIQNFVLSSIVFESYYRTRVKFPDRKDIFFATYATFLTFTDQDQFFADAEHLEPEMKKQAQKIFFHNLQDVVTTLSPIMDKAQITEEEFYAIMVLLYWGPYFPTGSQTLTTTGIRMRTRILRELHSYYRGKMELDDYSDRLCAINAILHTVQGLVLKTAEDFEYYAYLKIFGQGTPVADLMQRL